MEVLFEENLIDKVQGKEELFNQRLKHRSIKQFRAAGLLMALVFSDEDFNKKVINNCVENGLVVDWFLFAPHCMRIAPPLTISEDEINSACNILLKSIETISTQR